MAVLDRLVWLEDLVAQRHDGTGARNPSHLASRVGKELAGVEVRDAAGATVLRAGTMPEVALAADALAAFVQQRALAPAGAAAWSAAALAEDDLVVHGCGGLRAPRAQ